MRFRCFYVPALLLAGVILFSGSVSADVAYPLGRQFPFSIDYQRALQSCVSSGEVEGLPSTGPYYLQNMKYLLGSTGHSPGIQLVEDVDEGNLRLFTVASETLRERRHEDTQDLFSLAGGVRYNPGGKFGALVFFNLDREKALDPDYTGKKWRGLAGDIETAAIYYKTRSVTVTLGRQRVYWGPTPVNLIISETAEPLDLFSAGFRKGRLSFDFLFARLDGSRPDSADYLRFPTATFNDNRYLVGHRIDISLHRKLRVGLFETSIFGGEGRSPELYYLNPLQLFHTAQLNENENDNTILGLDWLYLPVKGLGWYGQFLVDDYQIDNEVKSDQEPDEIGLMTGLYRTGKPGSLEPDVKLEYVRITNRTYHQILPRNRYLYRNKLLGHPLGPDADSVSLSVRFWPRRSLMAEIETAYSRHGEGSIYDSWDEPWMDVEGDYSERFPTGVVQKGIFVAGRIEGYVPIDGYCSDHVFFRIRGGYGSLKNYRNIAGDDDNTAWLALSLSWLGGLELGLGE